MTSNLGCAQRTDRAAERAQVGGAVTRTDRTFPDRAMRADRGPNHLGHRRWWEQGRCAISELTLVHVHERTVRSAHPVGEAEAFVQTAGGLIRLVDADVHGVCTALTRHLQGRLHERPTESLAAPVGNDVQLSQVTLQTAAPYRHAEAEDGQAVWSLPDEQDDGVAAIEKLPRALGQGRWQRRGLVEFSIEVVK